MTVHAFPSADILTLRRMTPDDVDQTLRIFRDAVRIGAAEHYDEAQRQAWAPSVMEAGSWRRARLAQPTWVADIRGEVVGFADLMADDLVGMLFVRPDFTRRGVGSALLGEIERQARDEDRVRLWSHVSLVAERVFVRAGFVVLERETVERHGQQLARAVMEKRLEPI